MMQYPFHRTQLKWTKLIYIHWYRHFSKICCSSDILEVTKIHTVLCHHVILPAPCQYNLTFCWLRGSLSDEIYIYALLTVEHLPMCYVVHPGSQDPDTNSVGPPAPCAVSNRVSTWPWRTGPFTLRMMERLMWSMNSTWTCVYGPWGPRILDRLHTTHVHDGGNSWAERMRRF